MSGFKDTDGDHVAWLEMWVVEAADGEILAALPNHRAACRWADANEPWSGIRQAFLIPEQPNHPQKAG